MRSGCVFHEALGGAVDHNIMGTPSEHFNVRSHLIHLAISNSLQIW